MNDKIHQNCNKCFGIPNFIFFTTKLDNELHVSPSQSSISKGSRYNLFIILHELLCVYSKNYDFDDFYIKVLLPEIVVFFIQD